MGPHTYTHTHTEKAHVHTETARVQAYTLSSFHKDFITSRPGNEKQNCTAKQFTGKGELNYSRCIFLYKVGISWFIKRGAIHFYEIAFL